jgi:hypothetical protein
MLLDETPDLAQPRRPTLPPLGDELPLFCEKCGYSLNALPVCRCSECRLLHFACPECGHHQPINTVRPAMHRALGRLRAVGLVMIALVKLIVIGGALLGWMGMGAEWYYIARFTFGDHVPNQNYYPTGRFTELALAFGIFGMIYGAVGRLLLLRWRMGLLVGIVLAALACLAIFAGWSMHSGDGNGFLPFVRWHVAQFYLMTLTSLPTLIGAACAWPLWWTLVKLVLPQRAGVALLKWQQEQSDRPATQLGRD